MSKDREELIEVMARGFRLAEWAGRSDSDWDVPGKVHEDNKEVWRDIARAALSAIEGAGFVVVPRLANGRMQASGRDALEPYVGALNRPVPDQWFLSRQVYEAMINAYSPKPSGVEDE